MPLDSETANFGRVIWGGFCTVQLKMMTRTRSKAGNCFRMNKAVHVGA
jgi:hypothetical protein